MNIVLDAFTNKIRLYKPGNKKVAPLSFEFSPQNSLNNTVSSIHALGEFLTSEDSNPLKNEKSNILIIPDYSVAFGSFILPALSFFKIRDVFETRFKLCFPNFPQLYTKYKEYSRDKDEAFWTYSIANKQDVDSLANAFRKNNIVISGIDYYSHFLSTIESSNEYPFACLVVGEDASEFFISRSGEVIAIYSIPYGEKTIIDREHYLESVYFHGNERNHKYASFLEKNFASREPLIDDGIDAHEIDIDSIYARPRELRMLKGPSLEIYLIRNNIRKFYSFINDLASNFTTDPWFIPLTRIVISSSDNFYLEFEEKTREYRAFEIEKFPYSQVDIASFTTGNNPLFKGTLKKERRTFDWKKLLSMDIGPKKKA